MLVFNKKEEKAKEVKRDKVKKGKVPKAKKQRTKEEERRILLIKLGVVVFAVILLYIVISIIRQNNMYGKYVDKVDKYDLARLYTDGDADISDRITKAEAVNVIVNSLMPIDESEDVYAFAKTLGIYNITEENKEEYATYTDTAITVAKAVEILLEQKLEITGKSSYKNIEDYSEENRQYILKAGDNGILESKEGSLSESKITKGQLSKMLIPFVEKYATIYTGKTKDRSIITDEALMPANSDVYPFILSGVPTEAYEKDLICLSEERFLNPIDEFKKRKVVYGQIEEYLTTYFDTILNVDYKTIDKDTFFKKIQNILYYEYTDDYADNYVDYVKKNKIQLKGNCEVLLPIIYNDGETNRVRIKVKFDILNTNTHKNILFPDYISQDNILYEDDDFEFYMDISMGMLIDAKTLRVIPNALVDDIISENVYITRLEK